MSGTNALCSQSPSHSHLATVVDAKLHSELLMQKESGHFFCLLSFAL